MTDILGRISESRPDGIDAGHVWLDVSGERRDPPEWRIMSHDGIDDAVVASINPVTGRKSVDAEAAMAHFVLLAEMVLDEEGGR